MKPLLFGLGAMFVLIASLSAHSAEFKGITLGLSSVSWNTQLPPAIAQKAGFLKDEGLDVRMITIASGGPIMMALLSSGEADMVISGAVAILRGIASGAPAVIAGSLLGKPDYTLFPAGGTAVRIAALRARKIDAAPLSSGERVSVEGDGFPVLLQIGKALPEFPFTVLAATKKFAGSHPEKVSAMLRALDRAIRLIREDKDKAIQIGKAYGLHGDPTAQRKALEYVAEDFEVALKKDHVSALLKVLEIRNSPEEFFDESYLIRSFGKK